MTTTSSKKEQGFTITELMFAMAFVAFVMIFIVTSIVQTMRTYNKGLAVREINQSGRQLNEDMTRSLRYAKAIDFGKYVGAAQTAQRICAGGVTYVWNIEGAAVKNTYADSSDPIKFIRVDDRGGNLCKTLTTMPAKAASRDLLGSQLSLQSLTLDTSATGRIVTIDTVISTQGANKPSFVGGKFECPTTNEGDFCAFGNFQTAVYIRNL